MLPLAATRTEHFIALVPYASMPFRVSIVPKRHKASWLGLGALELEDLASLLQMLWKALFQLLDDPSYRMFILSADPEDELDKDFFFDLSQEGQSFHWSLELQPQLLDHGLQLSSGLRVASQLPEACAEMIRKAIERRPSETWMILPVTGRGIQCTLCSFMDCFRLMRQASQPEANEMLFVGNEVATEAVSIQPAANLPNETREPARPRRQRPPFPGVPVDPASVGLELLPVLNESQLQHVFETRTRATRAAEN
eukprot:s58_g49.t3